MDRWNKYIGKRIFVILKSDRRYSGTLQEISEEKNGIRFLEIIDRFGKNVSFVDSEIELIEEERR